MVLYLDEIGGKPGCVFAYYAVTYNIQDQKSARNINIQKEVV
jgi:hypothetical protein